MIHRNVSERWNEVIRVTLSQTDYSVNGTPYAKGRQSFHWSFFSYLQLGFVQLFVLLGHIFRKYSVACPRLEQEDPRFVGGELPSSFWWSWNCAALRNVSVLFTFVYKPSCFIVWLWGQTRTEQRCKMGISLWTYWRKLSALIWAFHW